MVNKKLRSIKKRGGCGCSGMASASQPINNFFSGGKQIGGNILGPASLTKFDPSNEYTIPLNMYKMDPLSPAEITDSRGLPNSAFIGGKKKRKSLKKKNKSLKNALNRMLLRPPEAGLLKRACSISNLHQCKGKCSGKKRRTNKKRGGAVDPVLQTYNANSLSNFSTNTITGAITGAHIVAGQPVDELSYQSTNVSKPFL